MFSLQSCLLPSLSCFMGLFYTTLEEFTSAFLELHELSVSTVLQCTEILRVCFFLILATACKRRTCCPATGCHGYWKKPFIRKK